MSMKVLAVYMHAKGSNATLHVEGLGEVKIENVISDELRSRMCEEACAALRVKLGQTLEPTCASSV